MEIAKAFPLIRIIGRMLFNICFKVEYFDLKPSHICFACYSTKIPELRYSPQWQSQIRTTFCRNLLGICQCANVPSTDRRHWIYLYICTHNKCPRSHNILQAAHEVTLYFTPLRVLVTLKYFQIDAIRPNWYGRPISGRPISGRPISGRPNK